MRQADWRNSPPRALGNVIVCAMIAMMSIAAAQAADPPSAESARHTAAIFTYRGAGAGRPVPVNTFCGVVINSKFILTSNWALSQSVDNPFLPPRRASDRPDVIYAVVQSDAGSATVRCVPAALPNPQSPVILLKVDEADEAKLAEIVPKPFKTSKLVASPNARSVGVLSTVGVGPNELSSGVVTPPVCLSVKMRDLSTIVEGQITAASIGHALPDSFVGAGVWNNEDQLTGIIARFENRWYVLDPASAAAMLKGPTPPAKPPVTTPEPPSTTTPTKPTPTVPKPAPTPTVPDPTTPTKPVKPAPANGLSPENIATAKPPAAFQSLLKEFDLTLVLPPGLIDHVKQEQADMVMAYIAGGKLGEAMETLNDIEPLVSGKLAEQLNYRRALALTLSGKYAEAKVKAQAAATAQDPLVAARGNLLNKILIMHTDGQFNGSQLSSPATLTKAAHEQLVETRRQLIGDFNALGTTPDPAQLKDLARRVKEASLAWPGYLSDLGTAIKKLDPSLETGTD